MIHDDAWLAEGLSRDLDGSFEQLVLAYQHRLFGFALRLSGAAADASSYASPQATHSSPTSSAPSNVSAASHAHPPEPPRPASKRPRRSRPRRSQPLTAVQPADRHPTRPARTRRASTAVSTLENHAQPTTSASYRRIRVASGRGGVASPSSLPALASTRRSSAASLAVRAGRWGRGSVSAW